MVDPKSGADDLSILHPNRTAVIAGKKITCREYGFIEELELRVHSQPFIDDLLQLLSSGEEITPQKNDLLFAQHIGALQQLIAQSADVDLAFVRGLNKTEGRKLMDCWWGANGPFFIQCATDYWVRNLRAEANKVQKATAAGVTSTHSSLPTATTQSE